MRSVLWLVWVVLAVMLGWRAAAYKAPSIEQDILARSTEAVKPLNPNAEIVADGRFVTVRGPEPNKETKAKTLAGVEDVWGALGPWDGLWTQPAQAGGNAAFEFLSADKEPDGRLTLTGAVASNEAKAAIETVAKASFSNLIDNQIAVYGRPGPSGLQNVGDSLKLLAALDAGSLLAMPDRLRLSGRTKAQSVADAANALASGDPAKWSVFVQGPSAAASEAAASLPAHFNAVRAPDGSIVASGDVASEGERGALLDSMRRLAAGSTVIDRLAVRDTGLPDDWSERIASGFTALGDLDWGSLSLDGAQSYLNGSGAPDRIGEIASGLGDGWTSDFTPTPADPDKGRIAALEASLVTAQEEGRAAAAKATAEAEAVRARLEDESKAALAKLQGETDGRARSEAELQAAKARIVELENQLAARPEAPETPVVQSGAIPADEPVQACNDAMARVMSGKTIEFATAKADITANGLALIDAIAVEARPCLSAGLLVTISGHTDGEGTERNNMVLSERRARAVKAALVERGLPSADITARGFGESRPIATNNTDAGRAQNRRIAFDWFVR